MYVFGYWYLCFKIIFLRVKIVEKIGFKYGRVIGYGILKLASLIRRYTPVTIEHICGIIVIFMRVLGF